VAFIVVTVSGKEVQRRNLDAPISIGRSLDCDLWIEDARLSRRHCQIDREGDTGWAIEDLGSRNGTYLHGHRVLRHDLVEGDVIRLGHTEIAFHEGSLPRVRPTDPTDALLKEEYHPPPHRRELPTKPLPTPKVSSGDTMPMPTSPQSPDAKPLPFTRPPARPIVKPREDEDDE
jgi:pSer/pThr/pTyr-binding forkhead associated (FHA) protein